MYIKHFNCRKLHLISDYMPTIFSLLDTSVFIDTNGCNKWPYVLAAWLQSLTAIHREVSSALQHPTAQYQPPTKLHQIKQWKQQITERLCQNYLVI